MLKGQLDNGLTYMIRQNKKPKARIELRLAVNAGSVLENEAQQGLAHFLEHMAFNGTENYKKAELVDYLESLGIRFGPDLNAYTSFDETVYKLQIPTDDPKVIESGLKILKDWAFYIQFEEEEIERERGVVIEEWRRGRGASQRIRDKQIPVIYRNSMYAQRLPIGKKEILESFHSDDLRSFYKDWYRPEQMCVIAVGELDPKVMEQRIISLFSQTPYNTHGPKRVVHPVPDHKGTAISIATDPEATQSSIAVYFKHKVDAYKNRHDYRRTIIEKLFNHILNQRLEELLQQKEPPYLNAYSYNAQFIRSRAFYSLGAKVNDNGYLKGLSTLLLEAERVRQHGFTIQELDRTKKEILRAVLKRFHERESTDSSNYARNYVNSFLKNKAIPSIETELHLHEQMLPTITLKEVNSLATKWITDDNRVILASGPQKNGVIMPREEELLDLFEKIKTKPISAYIDHVSQEPLLNTSTLLRGSITQNQEVKELGVSILSLSNGSRVILKSTTFKQDEILFSAFRPGGHSLASDKDFIPASSADLIVQECGIGSFSKNDLIKKLSGQIVHLTPVISELQEGFTGMCAPSDLETLFQLIHLHFTSPRSDVIAFDSLIERKKSALLHRLADPEAVFSDHILESLSMEHLRRKPWNSETVKAMDLTASLDFYTNRFSDAGGFTFLFTGNFDGENIKPLIEQYLASLPSTPKIHAWQDRHIPVLKGKHSSTIQEGLEDKAMAHIIFTDSLNWSYKNRYHIRSMLAVLKIILREKIREEIGGTYHVSVYPILTHYPQAEIQIHIVFGCAPHMLEKLVSKVYEEIEIIKNRPIEEKYLTKIKQSQLRQRETALETNEFWTYVLEFYTWHNEDLKTFLDFEHHVESLTKENIQNTANNYLDTNQCKEFRLLPASFNMHGL